MFLLKMRININYCKASHAKCNHEREGPALGLHQLQKYQAARVTGFRACADDSDQQVVMCLMEIGFLPGETVHVIATGFPKGDPLAVRVGQSTFALRRHEAAWVEVALEVQP